MSGAVVQPVIIKYRHFSLICANKVTTPPIRTVRLLPHKFTEGIILIYVNVNSFLVIASAQNLFEQFYNTLAVKYTTMRLERPHRLLGWNVTYPADGRKIFHQSALVHTTTANYNIKCVNGLHTHYAYGEDLSPSAL